MKIHILTPFHRVHLIQTLIHYLEPMNIEWYPIVLPKENVPSFNRDWIHPVCLKKETMLTNFIPYEKINDFIATQEIFDADYYSFLGDDDMYEPGFCDVIRQQTSKILFYSIYRGDSIPKNAEPHPPIPIILKSLNDIRVCNIGFGMCTLKGEILKQTRFKMTHKWDDGRYMESLKLKFPNEIKILSDTFVFGNYFEPGRYTNKTKFIKPNWELPEYF